MSTTIRTLTDRRHAAKLAADAVVAERTARRNAAKRRAARTRSDWTLAVDCGPGTIGLYGVTEDGQPTLLRIAAADRARLVAALLAADVD